MSRLWLDLKRDLDRTQILMIDFVCVFFTSVLWNITRGLTWQPVLFLLFPIYLHIAYQYPVPKPDFRKIIPVLIVLAATGISAKISHDPQNAIEKLFVVFGACILFGAIAIQPAENIHKMIVFTGIFGGLWTIFFLLTQRWDLRVVDLSFVNAVITKWESVRPEIFLTSIQNEDILGGTLAIFTPLLISVWILKRKYYELSGKLLVSVILGLILFGVFISGSRPAWAGLFLSVVFYSFLFFSFFAKPETRKRSAVLGAFFIVLLLFVGGLFNFKESSALLGNMTLNFASLNERQSLYHQTGYLVRDFFFTGGGLASFPGLYSGYILKIHNLYLSYGHHLYLDLWLELGILGVAGFAFMILQSFIAGLASYKVTEDVVPGILLIGVLSSLVVLLFSGFYEDPLFGLNGTVFLLFLPGMVFALDCSGGCRGKDPEQENSFRRQKRWQLLFLGGASVLICGIVLGLEGNAWLAKWYSNLGSVALAKVELREWPEQAPGEFDDVDTLSAESYFEKALQYDPENFTSNYRQGIIAFRTQEFSVARNYLEKAFQKEPEHTGIHKYLAYSYAWSGDESSAYQLFQNIPEARQELQIYSGWLETIGKTELADIAISLAGQLE